VKTKKIIQPASPCYRHVAKELTERVFCSECGSVRMRHAGSRYAVCPRGCGRLVARFTRPQIRMAVLSRLPRAFADGHGHYTISRRKGTFVFRDGDGRRPAAADAVVGPDQVVAWLYNEGRLRIRIFTRLVMPKRKRGTAHAS